MVVSHSRKMSEGTCELTGAIAGEFVKVRAAGGNEGGGLV